MAYLQTAKVYHASNLPKHLLLNWSNALLRDLNILLCMPIVESSLVVTPRAASTPGANQPARKIFDCRSQDQIKLNVSCICLLSRVFALICKSSAPVTFRKCSSVLPKVCFIFQTIFPCLQFACMESEK